eukprot:gene32262-39019_t
MVEDVNQRLCELQVTFANEAYKGVEIVSAESPRLTECVLTDYSPLLATDEDTCASNATRISSKLTATMDEIAAL